jgi:hypothetical protein
MSDEDDDLWTWRRLLTLAMGKHGEGWADVEGCTLDDTALDMMFDVDGGSVQGEHFTLWTRTRVYFPACYDGTEWVASVPRHPCDEATEHVGG